MGSSIVPYPTEAEARDALDVRHANTEAARLVQRFYETKSTGDVEATMALVDPAFTNYTDATLSWGLDGFDALRDVWARFMPSWGAGRSYPTRIVGDVVDGDGSVVVCFTDTPELFGDEIHIHGALDFRAGLLTREVDYWDASDWSAEAWGALVQPEPDTPAALARGAEHVDPRMREVATALHAAVSAGDADAAAGLLGYDAVYEDVALRLQLVGANAIHRYLARTLTEAPFGVGVQLGHLAGGRLGGGLEWARDSGPGRSGMTVLELGETGRIQRATVVWNGRDLPAGLRARLAPARG